MPSTKMKFLYETAELGEHWSKPEVVANVRELIKICRYKYIAADKLWDAWQAGIEAHRGTGIGVLTLRFKVLAELVGRTETQLELFK